MTNISTPIKTEPVMDPIVANQNRIDNHKKAAKHHEEAAKSHLDAAKNHEEGNHDKALKSTVKAQGHLLLASESQKEVSKNHALNN
jgi:hypothetical protein